MAPKCQPSMCKLQFTYTTANPSAMVHAGWGGLAPLTGWVVGRFGAQANIYCYAALGLAAAGPMWLLPIDALAGKKNAGVWSRRAGRCASEAGPAGAVPSKGTGRGQAARALPMLGPKNGDHGESWARAGQEASERESKEARRLLVMEAGAAQVGWFDVWWRAGQCNAGCVSSG
jgi:hypothetical protein